MIQKTYRIPGTKLYAYVEVFFDDDLEFYDHYFNDAITVWALILKSRQRTSQSTLSMARGQTFYDKNFKKLDITTSVITNGRINAVNVICTAKKPIAEKKKE